LAVRKQLGIYPIYDYAVEDDGGVYLITTIRGICEETDVEGFAYKPSLEPRNGQRLLHTTDHLWGDWYTFQKTEQY
jgi:hypothetical protein